MPDKWMNPGIGLLAGLLTYMLVSSLLVSGDRGGIVGVGTFIGTFAVVWGGLDFLSDKPRQGRAGDDLKPEDAT